MSKTDKTTRFRFGAVDVFVIVLLLGLIAGGIYRFTAKGMEMEIDCTVVYTLKIEGVREFTYEYYKEGLECYDKVINEYIGTIKSVRYEPLVVTMTQLDGSLTQAEQPGIIRIFLEVEAPAAQTDSAIYINGTQELKVGTQVSLNTKYIDVTATFISAEIKNK